MADWGVLVPYLGFGGRGALLDALRQGGTGHFATNGTRRNWFTFIMMF